MKSKRTALIVVDVQNDFCPGGALPIPRGDEVIELIEKMILLVYHRGWEIFASRDWHPRKTTHFKTHGGAWPEHCVQETYGADFHPNLLKLRIFATFISKGTRENEDAYSAFDGMDNSGTPLLELLEEQNVETIFICGLATDYCVKATALDAKRYGLETHLLLDACRAVNLQPDDEEKAVEEMRNAGVVVTTTDELLSSFRQGEKS